MVAGCGTNQRVLKKVAEIYTWLDLQIRQNSDLASQCNACGKCCDFGRFDHRLFITGPELMYLTANLGKDSIKPMPTSRCPYNIDGKCSVYKYRFAGCRIYYCNADKDLQSSLSELTLEKLKSICMEFQIPYRYTELATALNIFAGV